MSFKYIDIITYLRTQIQQKASAELHKLKTEIKKQLSELKFN